MLVGFVFGKLLGIQKYCYNLQYMFSNIGNSERKNYVILLWEDFFKILRVIF